MKVNILKDEKDHLEFELEGEDYSIPGMLKEVLEKNKHVTFVTFVVGHPMRDAPKMVVKTDGASARDIVKKALKEVMKTLEDFRKQIK